MAPKTAPAKTTEAAKPKQGKKRARDAEEDDGGLVPQPKRSKQAGQGFTRARPSTGAAPAAANHIINASSWPSKLARQSSRGMRNPGMFCYRNATLQALLHAPEFVNHLNSYEEWCQAGPDNCITCAARRAAYAYWQKGFYFSQKLTAFNNLITPKLPDGADWGNVMVQQDAAEFFTGLVNSFGGGTNAHSGIGPGISNLFELDLSSTTTCNACGHVQNGGESFSMIDLGSADNRDISIDIEDTGLPEWFAEPRGGLCETCKANAGKIFARRIIKAPTILAIKTPIARAVEKSRSNPGGNGKRQKYTTYPVKLPLQKFTADDTLLTYTLYAVVAHRGLDLTGGHYVAVVREPDGTVSTVGDSKVYRCNTAQIGEARLREPVLFEGRGAQDAQPIVLFYRKDEDPR